VWFFFWGGWGGGLFCFFFFFFFLPALPLQFFDFRDLSARLEFETSQHVGRSVHLFFLPPSANRSALPRGDTSRAELAESFGAR